MRVAQGLLIGTMCLGIAALLASGRSGGSRSNTPIVRSDPPVNASVHPVAEDAPMSPLPSAPDVPKVAPAAVAPVEPTPHAAPAEPTSVPEPSPPERESLPTYEQWQASVAPLPACDDDLDEVLAACGLSLSGSFEDKHRLPPSLHVDARSAKGACDLPHLLACLKDKGDFRLFLGNATEDDILLLPWVRDQLVELQLNAPDNRPQRLGSAFHLLEKLDLLLLAGFRFTNLSALAPLPLKDLSLWGSDEIDLDSISKIESLESLSFIHCEKLVDLSPLRTLTKLKSLSFRFTEVRDISVLSRFRNLEILDMHASPVSSVAPLRNLRKLTRVDASYTNVRDLRPLVGLPLLTDVGVALAPQDDGWISPEQIPGFKDIRGAHFPHVCDL